MKLRHSRRDHFIILSFTLANSGWYKVLVVLNPTESIEAIANSQHRLISLSMNKLQKVLIQQLVI